MVSAVGRTTRPAIEFTAGRTVPLLFHPLTPALSELDVWRAWRTSMTREAYSSRRVLALSPAIPLHSLT